MFKMIFGMLMGVALAAGAYWYFQQRGEDPIRAAQKQVHQAVNVIQDEAKEAARDVADRFKVDNIKDELAKSGVVVREKAKVAGQAISDAAANAKTTAVIKGKLLADKNISATHISVDTTDGVVTMSGKVQTPEELARAIKIAYDTDGVTKVHSTIQVSK